MFGKKAVLIDEPPAPSRAAFVTALETLEQTHTETAAALTARIAVLEAAAQREKEALTESLRLLSGLRARLN
jgi:hypothetical protein